MIHRVTQNVNSYQLVIALERQSMDETCTVYVSLLDEGTDVWRPVEAIRIGENMWRLCGPIPEDETWQFQPNDVVKCEEKWLSDGLHFCAVERIAAWN